MAWLPVFGIFNADLLIHATAHGGGGVGGWGAGEGGPMLTNVARESALKEFFKRR